MMFGWAAGAKPVDPAAAAKLARMRVVRARPVAVVVGAGIKLENVLTPDRKKWQVPTVLSSLNLSFAASCCLVSFHYIFFLLGTNKALIE